MIINISGYDVIIDDEDYDKVMEYKWHIKKSHIKHRLYYFYHSISKYYQILLHRFIMNCKYKDGKIVDHINGNTLDNRKSNLRICTQRDNTRNRKINKNNTTGYKGVSFHKQAKKYRSKVQVNNKDISLGLFDTPEEAHKAYCKAANKYYGEFANYG